MLAGSRPTGLALLVSIAALLAVVAVVGCRRAPEPAPPAGAPAAPCPDDCCNADYLALPTRAGDRARPVSTQEVTARIDAMKREEAPPLAGTWTRERLRERLIEDANVGFLLDSLDDASAPRVATSEPSIRAGVEERRVRWEDPWVGTIEGLLLLPPTPLPERAAVIAVHGHQEDVVGHASAHGGYALARAGFVVVVPRMRATGLGACESDASWALLEAGMSLVAVHAYEILRVRQWLARRPDVEPARIALVGHSGGAVVGGLAARLGPPGFLAFVSDFTTDFAAVTNGPDRLSLLDETSPALHPYRALLADLSTLPFPALRVDYNAATTEEGYARIEEFLLGAARADHPLSSRR